jgi:hypothetical protein
VSATQDLCAVCEHTTHDHHECEGVDLDSWEKSVHLAMIEGLTSTLTGWQIIGYYDRGVPDDIPRVVDAVLRQGDKLVVLLDPTLETPECVMFDTVESFRKLVADGSMQRGVDLPWQKGQILFIPEGTTTPLIMDIKTAELRMKEFVGQCRTRGDEQLVSLDRRGALKSFDLSRRVSNEADDYVRVYALSAPGDRAPWSAWLKRHAPELDLTARCRDLRLPL